MKCKLCDKDFCNSGALAVHKRTCEQVQKHKLDIICLYKQGISIKKLRDMFSMGGGTITSILKDGGITIRNTSESGILSHILYPEKFKHTDETKKLLRKKRLDYMRLYPEKTAWRMSNLSYPEKLFLNKIKELEWDKKYLIVREKSMFPYFIDFAFENEKLAVEIDGSQHLEPERKLSDDKKNALLLSNGWKVIRFTAHEIKTNLDNSMLMILKILDNKCEFNNVINVGIYKYEKPITLIKNIKENKKLNKNISKNFIIYYCICGNIKSKYSSTCKECSKINSRHIIRPQYDDLIKDINEIGYCATGRKYNVSDNSIRKWKKYYEKIKDN